MQDHLDTETNLEIQNLGLDKHPQWGITYDVTSDKITALLKDISIEHGHAGYYGSVGGANSTTLMATGSCATPKETFYFRSLEHVVSALGYLKLSGIRLALDTEIWLVKANKTIKNEL